jgi:hypothetical protein
LANLLPAQIIQMRLRKTPDHGHQVSEGRGEIVVKKSRRGQGFLRLRELSPSATSYFGTSLSIKSVLSAKHRSCSKRPPRKKALSAIAKTKSAIIKWLPIQ